MSDRAAWIAVDWGTSNLRVWAMDAANGVIAEASSAAGMAALAREAFEPALLALIEAWLAPAQKTHVIVCGMAGARQGWLEAPYASVPCAPVTRTVAPVCRDPRLDVKILAGIKQDDPPDVMRGEETQIAGVLLRNPGFAGVICLPGTHTKWAVIENGIVLRFKTFMTGELFALLSTQSVLRHSVEAATSWDDEAFVAAVHDSLTGADRLAANLFSVRAGALVAGLAPAAAKARLSGLLIGAEIAATRELWTSARVLIAGNGRQAGLYAQALTQAGAAPSLLDASELTLAGLVAARASIPMGGP